MVFTDLLIFLDLCFILLNLDPSSLLPKKISFNDEDVEGVNELLPTIVFNSEQFWDILIVTFSPICRFGSQF